jgi:amidophosphoribosyltransferase
MSEQIKHECGLALIRLLKPLSFYQKKYGTALYGLNKLQLLLQKQRNRGQDGAGVATIKLDMEPGSRFISRKRSNSPQYLRDVFAGIYDHFNDVPEEKMKDVEWLKENLPYTGELLLGHLRYGTHSSNTIETVHPFLRQNNYISRNLALAGNFNLTNVDELFDELISYGQYPKEKSDTVTVLEKIGHFLDDEVQRLYSWFKPEGFSNVEINDLIADHMDIQRMLRRACRKFDGGYVMAGLIGHGDAFVLRDPSGIRPAFYYYDDEIVVVASERPAIQTVCDLQFNQIKELERGNALIIKKNGEINELPFREKLERNACSFERIYFSRGTDRDIYLERKKLGELLADDVMSAIGNDLENTIITFIPNTAEVAFFGLVEGLNEKLNAIKKTNIQELGSSITDKQLDKILSQKVRIEKLAVKDARGTTLKESIIKIVSRLRPKKIIIVSSAPQIRFPDCYGIDMSKMKNFAAFRALVQLLEENNMEGELEKVYYKCKAQEELPIEEMKNEVSSLYSLFSYDDVSNKIAKMLTPDGVKCEVQIIYQTIEKLHKACPDNKGDWYFSGNYPTKGGNRVINRAFINYMEKKDVRAY